MLEHGQIEFLTVFFLFLGMTSFCLSYQILAKNELTRPSDEGQN